MTDRAKEPAAALRCTSTAGEGQGCTRCSFWRVEQVPEEQARKLGTAEWRIRTATASPAGENFRAYGRLRCTAGAGGRCSKGAKQ